MMNPKDPKTPAPAHVPRVKRPSTKQLGSPKAAPQGAAASGLPEASAQVAETTGPVTRSVKVIYSRDGKAPLQVKEVGVRKDEDGVDKMVEADEEGVDQLVALPGPLEVSLQDRRINGIDLKAGEEFISQLS